MTLPSSLENQARSKYQKVYDLKEENVLVAAGFGSKRDMSLKEPPTARFESHEAALMASCFSQNNIEDAIGDMRVSQSKSLIDPILVEQFKEATHTATTQKQTRLSND
ncbi:hypothetical protein Tco_1318107 [Tanacetum coccineum]